MQAKTLNDSLAESRNFSGHSVEAARAYLDISEAISDSDLDARAAINLAEEATRKVSWQLVHSLSQFRSLQYREVHFIFFFFRVKD